MRDQSRSGSEPEKDLSSGRAFFRRTAPTVAFAILLYLGLTHISDVMQALRFSLRILSPLLIGGALAFLLNLPMRAIERRLPSGLKKQGARRAVSLLLAFLLLLALVTALVLFIFPQVWTTISSLLAKLPGFIRDAAAKVTELLNTYAPEFSPKENLAVKWESALENLWEFLSKNLPLIFNATASFAGSLVDFVLGSAVCMYILASKERLGRQTRKLCYAFLPEKKADRLMEIASLSHGTFRNFVTGQLTEACILGGLCGVGALILGFPLPALCGLLVGLGGLIPIFGALVMTILCALLIAVEGSLLQALGFVVFIIVLQQIEGNFIYPRVVGDAVGLPGLWVLLSVTVGGALLGLTGMLTAVPVTSVLYTLLGQSVNRRLKARGVPESRVEPPAPPQKKRRAKGEGVPSQPMEPSDPQQQKPSGS